MPFDPARDLPMILGSLAGMGQGSNAFSRRWMQLEQMRQQQEMQQQQQSRLDAQETRQADAQQQQLMLQADAGRRADEQQRLSYTANIQRLFADPNIDPDVALQLATMGLPTGYDAGAVQSMHARVFTPDERTRRKAVKRLADIENDPQVKKLIASGQDVSATAWESPELGSNPEDMEGRPIYTVSQLQRLAQKPTPATPLPKVTPTSMQPNTPEERIADAIRRGDTEAVRVEEEALRRTGTARRAPDDPVLGELRQIRLEQAKAGAQSTALPPATQRRVDAKTRAFDQQPVVKRIQTMAEAVQFAEGLNPNTSNPADDQALIYNFAKAMDPESVVREGEYATVAKYAQSWAERFGFEAARIFSNTPFLTPQARQNMKTTIRARYSAAKPQYDNLRTSYAKQINQITGQGDGDTYLVDYAAGFPAEPTQAPTSDGWVDVGGGVRIRERR